MNSSRELYSCRFCAEKKILSDLLNLDDNPEHLHNCLQRLVFLKIDFVDISDKLPKFICEACNDALSDAYTFIVKVKEAQLILNYAQLIKSELYEENVGISTIKRERIEESCYGELNIGMDVSKKSLTHSSKKFATPSTSNTDDITNTDMKDNSLANDSTNLTKALRHFLSENKFDKQKKIFIFDFINNETLEISADRFKEKPFVQKVCAKDSTTDYQSVKNEQNNMNTVIFTEVPITNIVTFGENNLSRDVEQEIENNITNFPDYSNICNADFAGLNDEDKLFEMDNIEEPNATVNPLSIFTSTMTLENGLDCPNPKTRKNTNTKATKSKETAEASLLIDEFPTDNVFSWSDYTWLCQHCDTKCDSMDDLREHSKLLHNKCCGYKCVDCPEPFITFNAFIEHVRRHRLSLR